MKDILVSILVKVGAKYLSLYSIQAFWTSYQYYEREYLSALVSIEIREFNTQASNIDSDIMTHITQQRISILKWIFLSWPYYFKLNIYPPICNIFHQFWYYQ